MNSPFERPLRVIDFIYQTPDLDGRVCGGLLWDGVGDGFSGFKGIVERFVR